LGTACGKYHRCSTMAIIDAGDSDILTEWLVYTHWAIIWIKEGIYTKKSSSYANSV
jgi:hypothetical protein